MTIIGRTEKNPPTKDRIKYIRLVTAITAVSLLVSACAPLVQTPPLPAAVTPAMAVTATDLATREAPPLPTAAAEDKPPPARPTSFPAADSFEWRLLFSGLAKPLDLSAAGDDSGRVFILEQAGIIRVASTDRLLDQPFLDIRSQVNSRASEQGLLGIAFHPHYPTNGTFFLNYTDLNGNMVVSRWQVSTDANRADHTSEQVLLRFEQPFVNHNGGGLAFGPDGYLYIASGDGGSGGDPRGYGQARDTLLGKLLRIDVNTESGYTIPVDNPFVAGDGLPEIWAYGLRNPWRFSFDRLTGDLYISDVGQNKIEEINFLPASSRDGVNFGWAYREGSQPFRGEPPAGLELVDPVWEYDHSQGCSVTGGYVYRGSMLPEWQGIYVFGDYCNGNIWGMLQTETGEWQTELLYQTGIRISSFGLDDAGELYLMDHGGGRVLRLERK